MSDDLIQTPLGSMSPDELCRLLNRLKETTLARSLVKTGRGVYFLITNGCYSTVVDGRDASTSDEAIKIAFKDTTQPWYFDVKKNNDFPNTFEIKEITHKEFHDWLKHGGG